MDIDTPEAKFKLGRLVITRAAMETLSQDDVLKALVRHARGDWGSLHGSDWKQNDDAVENGDRILSQYQAQDGTRFCLITECDRSATTILLPEDY